MSKECSKCGKIKNIDEYYKEHNQCKKCMSQCSKNYHKNNKAKIVAQRKRNYESNKDKYATIFKEYHEDNNRKILLRHLEYRKNNRDKIRLSQKEYDKKNIDKKVERSKIWRKNNKEYIATKQRDRYKNNIEAKIATNLRSRLLYALKSEIKYASALKLLGCSIEEFKQYLENQFVEGMSWENHSFLGWHIDHKRPCASFNLSDPEQQKKCFHYSNLQPLWAMDNFRKNAIYKGVSA